MTCVGMVSETVHTQKGPIEKETALLDSCRPLFRNPEARRMRDDASSVVCMRGGCKAGNGQLLHIEEENDEGSESESGAD
jgi:hypothetical protein